MKLISHQGSPAGNITVCQLCWFPSLTPVLTQLLTADSIAQTGTDHLLAALASEPALPIPVDGSRVCAARPLSGCLRTGGGHHNSACGCETPKQYQERVVKIRALNAGKIRAKLLLSKAKWVSLLPALCLSHFDSPRPFPKHWHCRTCPLESFFVHLSPMRWDFLVSWSLQRSVWRIQNIQQLPLEHVCIKHVCVCLLFLLLEVHVICPFPSPRQVQSSIIQPWYGFSQVSPTTYDNAALLS